MNITFECLGFGTNPVFLRTNNGIPINIGWVDTRSPNNNEFKFLPCRGFGLNIEADIIKKYKAKYAEHGVVINDTSCLALEENRFGEPKKD